MLGEGEAPFSLSYNSVSLQSEDNVPFYCTSVKVGHPSYLTLLNKGRGTLGLRREKDTTRNSLLKTMHGYASRQMGNRSWGMDKRAGPHNHTSAGNIRDLLRSSSPKP